MKTYGAALVRERLAEALDEAERGVAVFIERRGVRYRLTMEPASARPAMGEPGRIDILDPAIEEGDWTWAWGRSGLRFRGKRRK